MKEIGGGEPDNGAREMTLKASLIGIIGLDREVARRRRRYEILFSRATVDKSRNANGIFDMPA